MTHTHDVHEEARAGHDRDARDAREEGHEAVRVDERRLAARGAALQHDVRRPGSAGDEGGKDGVQHVAAAEVDRRVADGLRCLDVPRKRGTVAATKGAGTVAQPASLSPIRSHQ